MSEKVDTSRGAVELLCECLDDPANYVEWVDTAIKMLGALQAKLEETEKREATAWTALGMSGCEGPGIAERITELRRQVGDLRGKLEAAEARALPEGCVAVDRAGLTVVERDIEIVIGWLEDGHGVDLGKNALRTISNWLRAALSQTDSPKPEESNDEWS